MHLACHQKHIWNLLQLLGLFTCRKLAHLSQNFVTETWNNILKLPGTSFLEWDVLLLKEHMVTSVRKMLKTLVWSAQSRLIPGKIALKITTKSAVFYRLLFGEVCPKNSSKITTKSADFSSNLSLKIPRNLTFSSATCQKPWQVSLLKGLYRR